MVEEMPASPSAPTRGDLDPMERRAEFLWVGDGAEFAAAADLVAHGLIPVIAPADAERRARWTSVLDWYGLKPAHHAHRPLEGTAANEREHAVIALDDEFAGLAEAYARARKRSFVRATAASDPEAITADGAFKSVVIVAAPQSLPRDLLQSAAQRLPVPWGVLTAADAPGLSFLMAKQLASAAQPARHICFVNVMGGTLHRVDDEQALDSCELSPSLLSQVILDEDWHALAIAAHGEGGHVNLNSLVLCGLLDHRESLTFGHEIEGCRMDASGRACKRVIDPKIAIAAVGDIRCERLVLCSCTGFVLDDSLFPTNINCILSAVEGYPRAVVATDRITFIDPHMPALMLGLLGRSAGLAAVVRIVNGLHARRFRWRPYMLCGDAAGPDIPALPLQVDGAATPPAVGAVPFCLADEPEPPVLGWETPYADIALLRSFDGGGILLQARPQMRRELRLIDATERYRQRRAWFEEIGRRLARAAWIERAVLRMCRAEIETLNDFREAMGGLLDQRLKLERCVQAAIECCRSITLHGVWHDAIDEWQALTHRHVGAWDDQFAMILEKFLLVFGDIPNILTDGFTVTDGWDDERCDHCKAIVTRVRLAAPLGDQPDQYQTDCPTCGRWENWAERIPRLVVTCPAAVHAGSLVQIDATCPGEAVKAATVVPTGSAVIQMEDKASGSAIFSQRGSTSDGRFSAELRMPENLSPDLHTFSVAWVQGLEVAFHRRRAACYRPHRGKPASGSKPGATE